MARFLSDEDVQVLKQVVDLQKKGRFNAPSRPSQEMMFSEAQDHQAPETYIAVPPEAGIPGKSLGAGTGTGSGELDSPGSAECDIYQLVDNNGSEELTPISGLKKTVYNHSSRVISEEFITITRDKFGKWWAPATFELLRAKTASCIGDNIYTFQRTKPRDVVYTDLSQQASSATGTGPGSDDTCDPCANVDATTGTGSSTVEGTCETTPPTGPDAGTVIDENETLYGIDPGTIPLETGGMAILADMGDTFTDSSGDLQTLYRVIEATRRTIVLFKDRYECCADGTSLLVGRTPIIVEGVECNECIIDICDATGTGT